MTLAPFVQCLADKYLPPEDIIGRILHVTTLYTSRHESKPGRPAAVTVFGIAPADEVMRG